jgi:glutamine synthetase
MFGYSLLRTNTNGAFVRTLLDDLRTYGIPVEGLHTETGPGVYEVALAYTTALRAADHAVLFKAATKEIGHRFGIMPSFIAKWNPLLPGCSGHVHQSLTDGNSNLFFDESRPHGTSRLLESYVAGQLKYAGEFGPLFWPNINSYKRLVDGFWAPLNADWDVDNRTASLRVIPGGRHSTRLETRCPGSDANPYLSIAACIAAGMAGIEQGLTINDVDHGQSQRNPRTLDEATKRFAESAMACDWLGERFVQHFSATRRWEWEQYQSAVTDWELKRYLEII